MAPSATAWESLADYGAAIGLAFQVVDDILDATQESETLGKTAGKDTASQKVTYPALFGIEESTRKADATRALTPITSCPRNPASARSFTARAATSWTAPGAAYGRELSRRYLDASMLFRTGELKQLLTPDAYREVARQTWLTHLTHRVTHAELKRRLPSGVQPACDGLEVSIP